MTQNRWSPFWVKIVHWFSLFFDFPPFSVYPSLLEPSGLFQFSYSISSCFRKMTDVLQMERTSSQELTDPNPPALPPATELRLFVALSPLQFTMLTDRRPILPDPYSLRFGLRTDPLKFESIRTCALLYVMVCTLRRASSSPFHQEVHVVLNHLHAARSAHTYFSLPTYWRRATAQTLTGLDTSGSVFHFSMNFVDQMSTRRSTTSSKTNTPSWFSPRTRGQDHHNLIYPHLRGSNPSKSLEPRRSSGIHPFCLVSSADIAKSQDIPFCGIP